MSSIYQSCATEHGNEVQHVLQCVSDWIESSTNNQALQDSGLVAADFMSVAEVIDWLLILTGALVFFMQAGFAMVCAGAIRRKNLNNTMLKNLLDACGAGLAFYAIGYGFAFGYDDDGGEPSSTFIGNANFFLNGVNPAVFFFQYAFSATCVTIIAGTLAERCRMAAYFAYSLYMTGFVYPVVAHTIWSSQGYFSIGNPNAVVGIGMIDFAGSGVVHMTGGCTALYATTILGARQGRFHDRHGNPLAKPGLTKGHSVALQMLGTFILFFGWFGFNPGSALGLSVPNKGPVAALAAVNTTLSAAAGTISALVTQSVIDRFRIGEYSLDIIMAMNGCLSGLVAVTASCAVIEPWAALIIGIVAGWCYIGADHLLMRAKLDDAVAAIQVHLASGLWGVLATGLFAAPRHLVAAYGTDSHPGLFYAALGSANLLPAQLAGALFIIAWTLLSTLPFFAILDLFGLFRVNALEELVGLDASYKDDERGVVQDDDEPSEEEAAVRLAAYRQRFAERKVLRDKHVHAKNHNAASLDEVLNQSWGNVQCNVSVEGASGVGVDKDEDDGDGPLRKKTVLAASPTSSESQVEQAPLRYPRVGAPTNDVFSV